MITIPPNDLRAGLSRAVPFRHTLNGLTVELEAEAVLFYLEHWGTLQLPDCDERIQEAREAFELAAAEVIAARYQLRVEWFKQARNIMVVLYEGDHYVDSQVWELGLTDAAQRIYGALLVLHFLNRGKQPAGELARGAR